MKLLITLATLAMVCIQQAIATAPISASINYLSFAPNGNITRFESTLVIPPATNADPSTGSQQIWPGIGSVDGSTFLLNHITNSYGAGTYNLEAVMLPQGVLNGKSPVAGGQALTTIFAKDITNGQFLDAWVVESGAAPNHQSYAGSLAWDPAKSSANKAYQRALLAVEFQGAAPWNFGTVSWQNIIIVAETTQTAWCTSPTASWKNLTWSTPVATVDGAYTTCYINSVTMFGQ